MSQTAIHDYEVPSGYTGVERQTVPRLVANALREQILSGQLAPGVRLLQSDVAKRFNVSTTPVREAFSLLEHEGLVTSETHRGVTVFAPRLEDLRQTYEIRIVLEALATREGVLNLSDLELQAMRAILDEDRRLPDESVERHLHLNDAFHRRIYAACENVKLRQIIADLRTATLAYQRLFITARLARAEGERHHEEIYAACARRVPDEAGEAVRAHLQHSLNSLTEALIEKP